MDSYSIRLAKICGIQPIEIKGHTVYPDFTEPVNFVKLYELDVRLPACKVQKRTISDILLEDYYASTRNTFLDSLIDMLEDDSDLREELKEAIKLRIRRAKWD